MISGTEYHSVNLDFKAFVKLSSTLAIETSNLAFFRKTYFCFQGAIFGVTLAKSGSQEVTGSKLYLPPTEYHKSLRQNTTNHSNEIPQNTPMKYHKLLQQNLTKTLGVLDITGKIKYCIIKVILCLEVMKNGV